MGAERGASWLDSVVLQLSHRGSWPVLLFVEVGAVAAGEPEGAVVDRAAYVVK